MKKILFFLLLFASTVQAETLVDRYVDTDCANNGDGTSNSCAGSPGGAGAYRTLQQALDDVFTDYPDMVSADVDVAIRCQGATADAGTGSTDHAALIDGFTMDATRNLFILADEADRHDGKWNTGKYRLEGSFYYGVIRLRDPYVTIAWLQIGQTRTGAAPSTPGAGIYIDLNGSPTAGRMLFARNVMRYTGDYTNQSVRAFDDQHTETSGQDKIFETNIIYDYVRGIELRPEPSGDVYAYANTCLSNAASAICYVIRGNAGGSVTINARNNIAQGTATGFDIDVSAGGTWTNSNNLSEDATSPNNTYDSKVITFVDEGGRDLHLDPGDTEAVDQGFDLSGVAEPVTVDIDNDSRPENAVYDIGADEVVAGGGGGGLLPLLQAIGED